jgi:hypothetical protein
VFIVRLSATGSMEKQCGASLPFLPQVKKIMVLGLYKEEEDGQSIIITFRDFIAMKHHRPESYLYT